MGRGPPAETCGDCDLYGPLTDTYGPLTDSYGPITDSLDLCETIMEDEPATFERRNRSEPRDIYSSDRIVVNEQRSSAGRDVKLRRQSTINNPCDNITIRSNNESRIDYNEINRTGAIPRKSGELVRPSLTKQYSYRELKKLRMERQSTQVKRTNYKRLGPQFSLSRLERQETFDEDMELPRIGWEFRKLRLMREMRKPRVSKAVQYESVLCGECDQHCERCQRRCCGDCQHTDGHQHFHWSTHHMTSLDCEDHSPLSHHHRRSRPRVNSAIFVSNDTAGFAGFDAGDFLRRYGSQSKLCRKARSADNIPLTTMEEVSSEKNSKEDIMTDSIRESGTAATTTSTTTATHHFGLPILSISGPSPPEEEYEQIDDYL